MRALSTKKDLHFYLLAISEACKKKLHNTVFTTGTYDPDVIASRDVENRRRYQLIFRVLGLGMELVDISLEGTVKFNMGRPLTRWTDDIKRAAGNH